VEHCTSFCRQQRTLTYLQGVDLDRNTADTARIREKLLITENNTMTGTGFSTYNKHLNTLGILITWAAHYVMGETISGVAKTRLVPRSLEK